MNEESKDILVRRLKALGYEPPGSPLYRPGTFDILEKTRWLAEYDLEFGPDFEPNGPETEYRVRLMLSDLDDERPGLESASEESRTRGVIHRSPSCSPGYVVWQ